MSDTLHQPLPHMDDTHAHAGRLKGSATNFGNAAILRPLNARKGAVGFDPAEMRPTGIGAPLGASCLGLILNDVDAAMMHDPSRAQVNYHLRLHVIDDIEFDCRQPFLRAVIETLVNVAVDAAQPGDGILIDVLATQYDNQLFVQVADTGAGLSDKVVQWFADHRPVGGIDQDTAGFVLVSHLVERAGGTLTLVRSSTDGTRIGFSLPLSEDAGSLRPSGTQ